MKKLPKFFHVVVRLLHISSQCQAARRQFLVSSKNRRTGGVETLREKEKVKSDSLSLLPAFPP